ncbi:outer membrane beta-barrel protein [Cesiribacter andamanensis]|uniref:Outer membrane protein beta-barrel domain-containing protein n=1 Tax=Cesiribacter andamanensis AMV16 TaxID=1279009 RepID=M7MY04_9BACT|nr:outer membrane beta-barrel protein [Cesiribacter andamanensis]EMR01313.1 hypothetical protein ADICEAN_03561 [Cesiribacter andamanensis AMV16]
MSSLAQSGRLSGRLLDQTGEPIAYANVALLSVADSALVSGVVAEPDGTFSMASPPPATYFLRISAIGFAVRKTAPFSVSGPDFSRNFGTLTLSEELETLKEVTVQALRPTITQEADRMVVSIEGTALAAGSTAFDVLSKSPGVFIDQEGNIQLNGRSGVTIMLDGKLTYLSARDLRSLLEGMSAENIKNIEIITNPSARYDAEGSSGILNINLKKNDQRGLNGSLYAGASYNGKQWGYSTGATFNYKTGRWNSFVNLDAARRVGGREATFTRVFAGPQETTYFDQVATGNFQVEGPPAVRAGTDYSINDRHTIGVMGYYLTNDLDADFLTDTYIGNAPGQYSSYIDADNLSRNRFTNYTGNLHYLGKLDTLGTTLSADLDVVQIRNEGSSDFLNYFYDLEPEGTSTQDFLYTETPGGFDIFSAKVDFTRPLSRGRKLELGAKASRVISDNDSRFYFNNTEQLVPDLSRSNHFTYRESIYAAYVNWSSKLGERFTVQGGLRAEQTVSLGELITTGQTTPRDYLNLFPSLFVQQKVSQNYGINYSYSRRIQRPNYGQLNPFFAYRDPYTYWLGNPYLRAQYTHVVGITQTFFKNYSLALNYQYNEDVIAELPRIEEETATTIYYIGNVEHSQNVSVTAIAPVKIMKGWESNNTLLVSYNEFNAVVDGAPVINSRTFYMLQSSHTVMLPLGLRLEVNGVYQGPGAYALYRVDPRWWVHLGLKKTFLDDKLDLSLNANDIFKTQRLKIAADVGEGNVSDFDQYFRAQSLGLTLRYRFSKGTKIEERRRNTLDELNRTGG